MRTVIRRGKMGWRWYCIPCKRERVAGYKARGIYRASKVRWRKNNPKKRAAHRAVEYALKVGILVRGPCEACGSTKNVQAHHDDYSKPLEVHWLCPKDHGEHEADYDG